MYSRIQYISQGSTSQQQIANITSVLEGGCKWIQLRFKNATSEEFLETAKKVKILCEKHEAIFIINDNVELAKEIDADGVHLGLTDSTIKEARNIIGFDKIIGGTANTLHDVLRRISEKCDYIGLGPYRFTRTKEKLSPILGLDGFQEIMNHIHLSGNHIPLYAIGGIEIDDIPEIVNTGVYGIAISGILTNQKETKEIITQLNKNLYANT